MKKPRGATLLELMVVGSIFLCVLTALWMIYDATIAVERKVSLKVDLDREIFAAVRHIDAALRTSRLVQPADWFNNPQPVDSISLMPLSVGNDGQPVINTLGVPQFGTPFSIIFHNGELGRPDIKRRFAKLGPDSQISFLRSSQGMLQMSLKVEKKGFRDQTTSRDLTFQFCLFNQ